MKVPSGNDTIASILVFSIKYLRKYSCVGFSKLPSGKIIAPLPPFFKRLTTFSTNNISGA